MPVLRSTKAYKVKVHLLAIPVDDDLEPRQSMELVGWGNGQKDKGSWSDQCEAQQNTIGILII